MELINALGITITALATSVAALYGIRGHRMFSRMYAPEFWISHFTPLGNHWYSLGLGGRQGDYRFTVHKIKSNARIIIEDKGFNIHRGDTLLSELPREGKSSCNVEHPLPARRDAQGGFDVSFKFLVKLKSSQKALRISIQTSDWIFAERYPLKLTINKNKH